MIELSFSNLPDGQLQFQLIASSIYQQKNILYESNLETIPNDELSHQFITPNFLNFQQLYTLYIRIVTPSQIIVKKLIQNTQINGILINYSFTCNDNFTLTQKLSYFAIQNFTQHSQSIFTSFELRIKNHNYTSFQILEQVNNQFHIINPVFIDSSSKFLQIFGKINVFSVLIFEVEVCITDITNNVYFANYSLENISIAKEISLFCSLYNKVRDDTLDDFLELLQFIKENQLDIQRYLDGNDIKIVKNYLQKLSKFILVETAVQCFDKNQLIFIFQQQAVKQKLYNNQQLIRQNNKFELVFSILQVKASIFSLQQMQDSITVQINSNNLLVEVENLTQYDPNLINISSFLATDFYFYQSVCKIKQIDESQQLYQVNTEINNLIGPIKQDFVHQKVILDDMSGFYDKFKGYQVFYSYFYQNIHRLENKLTPQLFPPNKEFNRQNPQQLEFKQVEIYESTVQRNLDDLEGYYLQMQPQRGGSMVVQQLDETNSASLLLEELEQIFPKRNQSPIKQNTVNNNLNQTYSNQQLIFLEQKLGYKIPRNLQGVNEVQNYILNITSANDLINILSTRLTSKNSDNSNKQVISQSQIYEISQNKFLDQNLCQTINNLQNIRSLSQLKNQDIIQTQQQQKQYDVRRKAERIKWM